MKKRVMLTLSLVACMVIAAPVYARGNARHGRGGGSRERKTDRRIDHRVDKEMNRRADRRIERHPKAAPVIEKRTERRGEKKKSRRDKVKGEEGKARRQERRPQVKDTADLNKDGTISPEERAAYKERLKTTHSDIKEPRRDLAVEHSKEYKDLATKYDANGDGVLNSQEWKAGKSEFKSTFGENVAEDIELYKVNKEKRQDLLEPPEPPEE